MTGWYILAAILVCLWLLSLLRVGGEVEYGGDGLRVRVRTGPLRVTVFPLKKKRGQHRSRKEKRPKKGESPGQPGERQRGGSFGLFRRCLPVLLDAAARLRKKVLVQPLELRLTIPGGDDPAACAVRYGQANAVMGGLWAMLNQAVRLRDGTVSIRADFDAKEYAISARAGVSLTVGQGIALSVHIGTALLRELMQYRKMQSKNRKAA